LKREARVLVTACNDVACAGLVVRLTSIDGLATSYEGCEGLCRRLASKGLLEESRYFIGNCGCGLERAPLDAERLGWALLFAGSLAKSMADLREELLKRTL
jgi:hypothetical protein